MLILGVPYKRIICAYVKDILDPSDDLTSYYNTGIYWIRQASCPVNGGMLLVLHGMTSGYSIQLLIGETIGSAQIITDGYIRTTGAWDQTYAEWKRIVS